MHRPNPRAADRPRRDELGENAQHVYAVAFDSRELWGDDAEPFTLQGNELGVLLLHGFTGSPQGLRLWGEALHRGGLTVHCPLLPGHGTHWRDLAVTGYADWEEASLAGLSVLRERCERVVVCALSFGGALALHLAARRPDEIRGVVAVNPWLYLNDRRLVLLPLLKHVLPTTPGIGSDIADSPLKELAYERVPLNSPLARVEGVNAGAVGVDDLAVFDQLAGDVGDCVARDGESDALS